MQGENLFQGETVSKEQALKNVWPVTRSCMNVYFSMYPNMVL